MLKNKLLLLSLPMFLLAAALVAKASFYSVVDIPVAGVSFGDGTSTSFTIKAGSAASTGWSLAGGALSVTGPQGFSVTASDVSVKTFLISSSSLESCVLNDDGSPTATIATSSGIWSISPSSMASCVPVLGTVSSSAVGTSTASLSGTISSIGAQNAHERGFVVDTSTSSLTVASADFVFDSSGSFTPGSFSLDASSLSTSTTYYFKSYAINRFGASYGSAIASFTTSAETSTSPTCPTVDHATSYNSYPTCGPATCSSGYHVSGSSCAADSSGSSGGSSGGGGGSLLLISQPVATSSTLIVSPSQAGDFTSLLAGGSSVRLTVPSGSVRSRTRFSVSAVSLSADNLPNVSSGAQLVGSQAFNITAFDSVSNQGVSSFASSLLISIKLPGMPTSISELGVYYFDESTKKWSLVEGSIFDPATKTVTFSSNHLTLFAVLRFAGLRPKALVEPVNAQVVPVALIKPVITESENVVNRYYPLLDSKLESAAAGKAASLKGYADLSEVERDVILKFYVYGSPSTKFLGAGERLGVVNSYLSAFGRLPKTVADFNDVIKIGTGRWPTASSSEAISKARATFKVIYKREPNMVQPNDNAAVTIMAYGLRTTGRNLNSERAAIKSYKAIFKRAPVSASDWDAVRAIAYSGAKR